MSDKDNGMSRRQFLGIAGGAIGAATLASIGLNLQLKKNEREVDLSSIKYTENETDILVIGGGIAGLFAAVKGHDAGVNVLMVVKGRLGSSGQTPFAKGIFSYDAATENLSLDEFVDQVSASALNTNNPVFTRQMAEHSMERVQDLKEWGYFDAPLCHNSFSKPITERNIPVMERIMITHLIKEGGRIAGAAGFSIDEPTVHVFKAKSVVLCTGAGGFKPSGFPICDLTHDGTVMSYKIGAKVTGKEWNDGHSGSTVNPAACYDGWHGMFDQTPSLNSVEIRHDLGVDLNYSAYVLGNPVSQMPGSETVEGGPYTPEGFSETQERGGPPQDSLQASDTSSGESAQSGDLPARDSDSEDGPPADMDREEGGAPGMSSSSSGGASAGMSIHKSEGLVPINEKGESNIPGLYAAGDALGSYMAGAIYTQIGSSMAGSAVQGAIVSEAAAEYCKNVTLQSISSSKISEVREEILAPLQREEGYGPAWVTQVLQGVMIPNFVLYIKKESLLRGALAYIEELRDHHSPMLRAANLHELRLAHETANMIVNAEMKLKASLMRTESRCSHYRLDYPDLDADNWEAWINLYKGADGEMKLEKQPFASWRG